MTTPIILRDAGGDDAFWNFLGYKEYLDDLPYRNAHAINAYVGDQMVGSVVYGRHDGSMWVYHIYVIPEYGGRGVGKRLMQEVADAAKQAHLPVDGDFTDPALKTYMRQMAGGQARARRRFHRHPAHPYSHPIERRHKRR